ncbi:MAG: DUF3604 domain-containing protein [Alphaproteobacteria bacterium]|nr:DUF3604 domain-containing protein [Alphaproteobacteria bacterium]
MRRVVVAWVTVLAACAGGTDTTDDTDTDPADTDRATEAFPRCAVSDPLRQPFFGDTHVHTSLSLDANLQGTRARPADAYAFAKGAPLGIQPFDAEGQPLRTLRLERPLDFVVVSDHAEYLGTVALCSDPASPAYDHSECRTFRDSPDLAFLSLNGLTSAAQGNAQWPQLCGDGGALCTEAGMDVWADVQAAAEAAYDRTDACTFTSFVGYEWSGGPSTRNLHRNVIFRNEAVPDLPVGYFDESFVDGLWDRLEDDCLGQAPCDVVTIPHNANLSTGLMFVSPDDVTLTAEEAARRQRMEPLVEVFQHKGDGECWPGSPLADELCSFEKLPNNTLAGANLDLAGDPVPADFVRDVLGFGLRYQQATGVNPYRYGIVASSDSHLGAPGAVSEAGYPGHGGAGRGNRDALPEGLPDAATFNPGGLAVLWAEENSREALFRAMRRGEAYGTSGPRIVLRFFGGWDYPAAMCDDADFAGTGYDGGVPMGGDLPASSGAAPRFALSALADAGTTAHPGLPLQRIQIVKGWLDGDAVKVRVVDVAGSADDGSTVDTATCAVDARGAGDLCGVWVDDDFDPTVPAFWYARAVEDPSCRWTTMQCAAAGITCPTDDDAWKGCCDSRVEPVIQERAWSSPIWYTPP